MGPAASPPLRDELTGRLVRNPSHPYSVEVRQRIASCAGDPGVRRPTLEREMACMRWFRLLLAVALVSLAAVACGSPATPGSPREKGEEGETSGQENQGLRLTPPRGIWV